MTGVAEVGQLMEIKDQIMKHYQELLIVTVEVDVECWWDMLMMMHIALHIKTQQYYHRY